MAAQPKNVTMHAKPGFDTPLPRSLVQGQTMRGEDTRPLCVQAETLLTDLHAIVMVLSGLEAGLAIQTLTPSVDTPDGLTAALAACREEVEVLRGMVENVANRVGRL
jgi:hypothetical protein